MRSTFVAPVELPAKGTRETNENRVEALLDLLLMYCISVQYKKKFVCTYFGPSCLD